ncbi:MAG: hypothetical protein ACRDYZ_10010 [Acidimicrobiales bacterium]
MFRHWLAGDFGAATFAVAMATVVGAALVLWFVCRRYSPRPAMVAAMVVLGASLLLPWMSYGSAASASTSPRPVPVASPGELAHALAGGHVRQVATVAGLWMSPATVTVYETSGGAWHQTVAPANLLTAKERGRATRLEVAHLPASVRAQMGGTANDYFIAFLVFEALAVTAGGIVVASVLGRPRRIDLDRAMAQLVAEHHGRETV